MARLYDAPPERTVRPAQWPPAGRCDLGCVALAHHASDWLRVRYKLSGAPVLGLVVWCVVCFAFNTLLDWLYGKTECIWVPAIAHGAFNAVAGLFVVLTNPADTYYNVLGPMPIGLIGMLPMLAAAVWLTLHQMKAEKE